MTRAALFLVCLCITAGCGGRPQSEIERGKTAVVAVLEGWKANEPPAKLKSLADSVEFNDELARTHTLTAYTLGTVDDSDKELIRYAVVLMLKDKKGNESRREVVFAVSLKSPVVVARDPYY